MLVGGARIRKAGVEQNTHNHPDGDQGVHRQDEDEDERFVFGAHMRREGPRRNQGVP